MIDMPRQINSLRLSRLFGGDGPRPPLHPPVEWFYNGSVRFEKPGVGPRVFSTLEGAVQYFTEKLPIEGRCRGQRVTWAEGTSRNWVTYIYIGDDLLDESYSNPDNWVLESEIRVDDYTDIEEVIKSAKQYKEHILAKKEIQETLKVE